MVDWFVKDLDHAHIEAVLDGLFVGEGSDGHDLERVVSDALSLAPLGIDLVDLPGGLVPVHDGHLNVHEDQAIAGSSLPPLVLHLAANLAAL